MGDNYRWLRPALFVLAGLLIGWLIVVLVLVPVIGG